MELADANKQFLKLFSANAVSYYELPLTEQAKEFLANANVDDRGFYKRHS